MRGRQRRDAHGELVVLRMLRRPGEVGSVRVVHLVVAAAACVVRGERREPLAVVFVVVVVVVVSFVCAAATTGVGSSFVGLCKRNERVSRKWAGWSRIRNASAVPCSAALTPLSLSGALKANDRRVHLRLEIYGLWGEGGLVSQRYPRGGDYRQHILHPRGH